MRKLFKALCQPEMLRYLVVGVLITAVSMASYSIARFFGIDYQTANVISWIASVTFAYVTNKVFVFRSRGTGTGTILREMTGFYGARLATLGLEMAAMWLMVDVLSVHDLIAKAVCQVLLVISNYMFSKFIVFKKKS